MRERPYHRGGKPVAIRQTRRGPLPMVEERRGGGRPEECVKARASLSTRRRQPLARVTLASKTRMPASVLGQLRRIRSCGACDTIEAGFVCKMASSISRSMMHAQMAAQKERETATTPQGPLGTCRRPSQGLYEQGAPRWRSSSKSRDHRSCSSLPKACDRAPGWRELERRGAGGVTCGNFWDWGDRVWPGFCGCS